mgnify:CR=1 FL=1
MLWGIYTSACGIILKLFKKVGFHPQILINIIENRKKWLREQSWLTVLYEIFVPSLISLPCHRDSKILFWPCRKKITSNMFKNLYLKENILHATPPFGANMHNSVLNVRSHRISALNALQFSLWYLELKIYGSCFSLLKKKKRRLSLTAHRRCFFAISAFPGEIMIYVRHSCAKRCVSLFYRNKQIWEEQRTGLSM